MKTTAYLIAMAACLLAAAIPATGAEAYYFGNTANNFVEPMQGESMAEFEARIPDWKMSTDDGVEYTLKNIKILDRYGVPVYDPGVNIKNVDTGESFGAPAMDVHIGYGQEVELVQTKYGYYVIPTTTEPVDVVFNVVYRTLIIAKSASDGVEGITVEDASEASYYTLQGQPTEASAPGVYIMVKNGRATKIVR